MALVWSQHPDEEPLRKAGEPSVQIKPKIENSEPRRQHGAPAVRGGKSRCSLDQRKTSVLKYTGQCTQPRSR